MSVFSPLLLVIVAISSWALLEEKLYLGTAIGSILIVCGLCLVLWGLYLVILVSFKAPSPNVVSGIQPAIQPRQANTSKPASPRVTFPALMSMLAKFLPPPRMQLLVKSYTSTTLMCLMASFECGIIAVIADHKVSAWSLKNPMWFISALYCGILGSALPFFLSSWSIQRKLPLYMSVFSPLLLIIVAISSWALLEEKLYLGTALSSAVDERGLRHMLLCRVILGKMEMVAPGSKQSYPSSKEMDNLQFPRRYVVWGAFMNSHIFPVYVVSFKAPSPNVVSGIQPAIQPRQGNTSKPASPWVTFPALMSMLAKFLPPPRMQLLVKSHNEFRAKQITRPQLIQRVRQIVGDNSLVQVIKAFRSKSLHPASAKRTV